MAKLAVLFLAALTLLIGAARAQDPFYLFPLQQNAYYVSTSGSDSNAGTLAAPFATLGKCQTAMQGSGIKTCFIRAGTYQPSGTSASCAFQTINSVLSLSASDNGETWSYYPPDGMNTAIIDGQSTGANGLGCAFAGLHANHVTVNGLYLKRFRYSCIWLQDDDGFNTVENSVCDTVTDALGGTNGVYAAGIEYICPDTGGGWSLTNDVIQHNLIMNTSEDGIRVVAEDANITVDSCQTSTTGNVGPIIQNNFLLNICTSESDCGAIYTRSINPPSANPTKVFYNYIRDVDRAHTTQDVNGVLIAAGIYHDGGNGNDQVFGNVLAAVGYCMFMGGDQSTAATGNICDQINFPYAKAIYVTGYTTGAPATLGSQTGNSWANDIILYNDTSFGGWGYYSSQGGNPANPLTLQNNLYYNYNGTTLQTYTATCQVVTPAMCSPSANADNNPTVGDPLITGWSVCIGSGSPAFLTPVFYQSPGLPAAWGQAGFWGPTSGVYNTSWINPSGATAPSWSTTGCANG